MKKLRLLLPLLTISLFGSTFKATSAQAGKLQESNRFTEFSLGTTEAATQGTTSCAIVEPCIFLPLATAYYEDLCY